MAERSRIPNREYYMEKARDERSKQFHAIARALIRRIGGLR